MVFETWKLKKWSNWRKGTFQMNNCFITSDKRKKGSRFRGKLRLKFLVDGRSNLRDNYCFHFIIVSHQPLNHLCGVTSRRRLIAQTKIWSEDTSRLIRVVEGGGGKGEVVGVCSCFNQVVMFMRRRSNALHHPPGLLWACSSPDLSFSRGTLWIIAPVTF